MLLSATKTQQPHLHGILIILFLHKYNVKYQIFMDVVKLGKK